LRILVLHKWVEVLPSPSKALLACLVGLICAVLYPVGLREIVTFVVVGVFALLAPFIVACIVWGPRKQLRVVMIGLAFTCGMEAVSGFGFFASLL
jgi:hypothetical protein